MDCGESEAQDTLDPLQVLGCPSKPLQFGLRHTAQTVDKL